MAIPADPFRAPATRAHRPDPDHRPGRPPVDQLQSEARRIARRLAAAEAVAECQRDASGRPGSLPRRETRSARLRIAFHATLDRLRDADAFHESIGAFWAYRNDLDRYRTMPR